VGCLLLASTTLAAAQGDPEDLTIALNEYEDSGVSGWAALTLDGDGVRVAMAIEGDPVTSDHPTHIHTGTCADFDPNPTYPLTTFVLDPLSSDSTSKTTVDDVSLDELLADDYVIVAHKSARELTTYFVCGDIKQSNAFTGPRTAGSASVPSTGTGPVVTDATGALGTAGRGMLAVSLVLAGFSLRRRYLATR